VIGGGSSVNGMASNRGLPSDYEDWAARGAKGWDWDGVLPYFKKLETDHDYSGPLHGSDGPIHLRRFMPDTWPGFSRAVINAIDDSGWSNIEDQNAAFGDGYFPVAYANLDERRVSAAMGYLTREARARPNFTIQGETHVERLLFEGRKVVGVIARHKGARIEIRAREVIVSMGAIHSPALLMRSGIGPAADLSALGIDVVADRAGVGQHLMEHPGVNMGCFMKPDARLPESLRRQMFAGLRWSSKLEGCPAGDMYIIPTNKVAWHAIGARLGVIMVWVNKSFSTGEVRLKTADVDDHPIVDFDMVSDDRDMKRLVAGVKLVLKLQAHHEVQDVVEEVFPISYSDHARKLAVYSRWNAFQTWAGATAMDAVAPLRRWIIKNMIADGPSLQDLMDDDLVIEQWIRSTVLGHWHACSTNRMGAPDDPGAVTDPSGRVYGVEGLRVCDSSIMPMVPCANTNIPTLMIGEKIASAILAETK
jgi:5-(hydroxymethyl)furfural/furfural oxidase